jgi:hypothetical protein
MAVKPDELLEIGELLSSADAEAQALGLLRARFPHLSWIGCDASDVTEEPFETHGAFDLHLLDAADHCVQITNRPDRATGVVLARRAES